jgi:hypothetical protein
MVLVAVVGERLEAVTTNSEAHCPLMGAEVIAEVEVGKLELPA